METRIDEVAERIYRVSTFVPEIAAPAGFTFNQFLVDAEEPLLFHTGPRAMFPAVSGAVAKVMPLERLRWVTFGHLESDESGSMNQWLAAAPRALVAHGMIMVSLNDLCDRLPRALADGETLDLGGRRVVHADTPHVPHGWDARALYEETTGTLLCGDLFAHAGNGPALTREDIVGPAVAGEDMFGSTSLTPQTGATIRRLGAFRPRTLALMHGSSYTGDAVAALNALADDYDRRVRRATSAG